MTLYNDEYHIIDASFVANLLYIMTVITAQSYDVWKCWNTLRLGVLTYIRSFAHYRISLSLLCRLVWRHRIYQVLVRHILSSGCLWFFQLYLMVYMGLCIFRLPISLVIILKICVLNIIITIKSHVSILSHCLGLFILHHFIHCLA